MGFVGMKFMCIIYFNVCKINLSDHRGFAFNLFL